MQHDCAIFAIINIKKETIICLFRFRHKNIISKHVFKTQFNSNKILDCSFAFGDILLFRIKNKSKRKEKSPKKRSQSHSSSYYAIYSIQNKNISCQYIRHWQENKQTLNKPLIVIPPSITHPKYQIASCLKNKDNKDDVDNNDIIWNLSLFIPQPYLRYLICIVPHCDDTSSLNQLILIGHGGYLYKSSNINKSK